MWVFIRLIFLSNALKVGLLFKYILNLLNIYIHIKSKIYIDSLLPKWQLSNKRSSFQERDFRPFIDIKGS